MHGCTNLSTLLGRVRPIPDINSQNFNMRGFADRTAVNTPLQGTAADLIKLAMIRIDEELRARRLRARMTLQVHDELVFEVPESEADEMRRLIREKMENVHPLRVPLKATSPWCSSTRSAYLPWRAGDCTRRERAR